MLRVSFVSPCAAASVTTLSIHLHLNSGHKRELLLFIMHETLTHGGAIFWIAASVLEYAHSHICYSTAHLYVISCMQSLADIQ